jgi:hypothetical protein
VNIPSKRLEGSQKESYLAKGEKGGMPKIKLFK